MIEDKYRLLQAQTLLFAGASTPPHEHGAPLCERVRAERAERDRAGYLMQNAGSAERVRLTLSTTAQIATTKGITALLKVCATQTVVEEMARYIPFVGSAVSRLDLLHHHLHHGPHAARPYQGAG